jgi:SPP1 gp7 family putative phage head morphogenesis protein
MAKKKLFNEPVSQQREYLRLLTGFVRGMKADARKVLLPQVGAIKREREAELRGDGWIEDIAYLIAELEAMAEGRMESVFERLPNMFAATSKFNDGQFRLVAKAKSGTGLDIPATTGTSGLTALQKALGIEVYRSEPYLEPLRNAWVARNTDLIKTLPVKLHPELTGIIDRGVANGLSVKQMQDQLIDRYGVTESRAKLIAQDQILKANAELTRHRMESVDVDEYIWRTMNDGRVRPEHEEREGKRYQWSDPPDGGHPGMAVRCRCRAEAVWPEE